MNLFNLSTLKEELRCDEGLRLYPYQDTEGVLSIGYGRNLRRGIAEDEAEVLLENDILKARQTLFRIYPDWKLLTDARQRCLLNMAFNLGNRLRQFKRMLRAVEKGDYEEAARQMLRSKWARQVGKRAERLARMMRKG